MSTKSIREISACALLLLVCAALLAAQTPAVNLQGIVTDPSGAAVPGAVLQLRGSGPEQRAATDVTGHYSFPSLRPGKYTLRVIAKGFTVALKRDLHLSAVQTLDVQLTIEADAQVVNVEGEARTVSADPSSNGGAIILQEKELAGLSDDPDELA